MSRRRKPKTRDSPNDAVVHRKSTGTFGEMLKSRREQRGLTLAQVAEETKIGLRYLEALEQNEFESLPGGVFNRGFVRAYAQFIGADTEKLVRDYAREEESRGLRSPENDLKTLKATLERQAPARRRLLDGPGLVRLVMATGIVTGAAALAGWGYVRHVAMQESEIAPLGPELAWNTDPTENDERAETTSDASAAISELPAEDKTGTTQDEKPLPPPAPVESPAVPTPTVPPPTESERPSAVTEPAEPPAVHRLSVSDFGVGERVVNRQLQGRADRFREGGEVWFWTRVLGGKPGQRILHLWFHEGREVGSSELRIGGSHWRTQSRRNLPPGSAGQWTVEARDTEGRTLAITGFVCEPSDSEATADHAP